MEELQVVNDDELDVVCFLHSSAFGSYFHGGESGFVVYVEWELGDSLGGCLDVLHGLLG